MIDRSTMAPWAICEIFSETILQLSSLGHYVITGGHQLLYGASS